MGRGVGISGLRRMGLAILLVALLPACDSGSSDFIEERGRQDTTILTFRPGTLPPGSAGGEPLVGQMVITLESGQVIDGLVLSNPNGDCIKVDRSTEVTIRNSVIGPCGGRAIHIQSSVDVKVEDSELIDSEAGVYALNSSSIVVSGNTISNAGRNPVQFDKVTGSGNVVSDNEISNQEGSSETEDSINIYQSSGTESSPLVVERNLISDGGSSRSGSGILVGDNGGSHMVVRGNTLINPGQVGIGVAGGQNISVVDNLVFSEQFPWSNVGIYVWDQYDTDCEAIEVRGNVVEWYNSAGEVNPFYDAGNCGEVAGWHLNDSSDDLGELLGQGQGAGGGDQ